MSLSKKYKCQSCAWFEESSEISKLVKLMAFHAGAKSTIVGSCKNPESFITFVCENADSPTEECYKQMNTI
jgi:hypothetical protein